MENQSIICFAPDPWDSMWRNRHQIMSRLSQNNKVLYIEPHIYTLRDGLVSLIRSLIGHNLQNERLKHIANDLWVYKHHPLGFKSNWIVLNQLGLILRILAIRHILRKLRMKSPILWVVDSRFGNMVKYFKKSLVCYHVVDNYTAAPYWSEQTRANIEKTEKFMLSIADLVVVTSPNLLEKTKRYNNNVHLVRNAVDYEKFSDIRHSSNIPKDMAHIPKPIIGYVGAVNEKLDYELIDVIVHARPNWSFVFVGGYQKKPGPRMHRFMNTHPSNVFLLGQRNVSDVPRYIRACHICILPYCMDDYTKTIDSLKLYEYFACEKPVVTTNIPSAREHSQVVYIAKDVNEFMQKLEKAMISSNSKRCALQRSIAMQNTWDKRVEQLSFLIQTTLQKKSGREL